MTKSQYDQHAEQLEAVAYASERAAGEAQEIAHFLHRHEQDGVIFCDANRSIIYQYFHGGDISESELEDAYLSHPAFSKSLAKRETETEVRANLAKEIHTLAPGSTESKDHVVAQLKYKTVEEIIIQRDELKRRKALKDLPKEELRELTRMPLQAQFKPIEPLYQNAEMIRKASPSEIRRLIRVSGITAINEILSKKSKD
jgi:hypothetical protein